MTRVLYTTPIASVNPPKADEDLSSPRWTKKDYQSLPYCFGRTIDSMTHVGKINEFFVEGKNQKNSHVLLHITEPTTRAEWERGYFFALCEIENGDLELIGHAQRLIDDIESGYYETEQSTGEKSPFELTLEFINRRSNHLLNTSGSLHCIVGVVRDTKVLLSYHGNPLAHVFFRQQDSIQSINILEGGANEDQSHLFSAVIEGSINEGDKLFIGTPHVTDEISLSDIQDIVMEHTAEQAVKDIEQTLKQAKRLESFGGIICEIVKKDTVADPTTSNSAASLQHLIDRERETTETLSPSLFGGKKKKEKQSSKRQQKRHNAIETNHRRRGDEIIGGSSVNAVLVLFGRGLVGLGSGLWRLVRFLGVTIGRALMMIFVLMTNKNNGRSHALRSVKESWGTVVRSVTGLSLVSKLLLLGVVVLSCIFVGSVGLLRIQEGRQQKAEAYTTLVSAIEDKRSAADARQIYNDESGAFALLKEAEDLVQTLPQDTDEQTATYTRLKESIETALLSLRNITVVTPTQIADLSAGRDGVQATSLVRLDDQLIAFGPQDTRLFFVDKDTGSISIQEHDSIAKLVAGNTPKENDTVAFVGQDNDVYLYNKEAQAINKTEISFPSDQPIITSPFIYNLRLYLVDNAHNQILRHSKTQSGYDRGTPWLDADATTDLSDAVSMAIDGDVFILKQNGRVLKFVGGTQEPFDISGLDPSLADPTLLYTYNDMDSIYILEPTNKRVVVLNKQGTFRAQYTSELWQSPTGMVVDEAKKTIYVLDNQKIYSFKF